MPRVPGATLTCLTVAGVLLGIVAPPARSELLGERFRISPIGGCGFPDAAYAPTSETYLVVYTNYNFGRICGRFVTPSGATQGDEKFICDLSGGLFPAVACNRSGDEFLVTWDDQREEPQGIWGQRVRASDGVLLEDNFRISSTTPAIAGGIRSAVAWDPVTSNFLVVWWGAGATYCRLVSSGGQALGADAFKIADEWGGYPAVAGGISSGRFLVTWDDFGGFIHGRLVNAATGTPLGASPIPITTTGPEDRSCIAFDPNLDGGGAEPRWLVQFNAPRTGNSYDQRGQFVDPAGALMGGLVPIAVTPMFEGDTLFGGDIAFTSHLQDRLPGRYFSSYQIEDGVFTGIGGQELLKSGERLGSSVVIDVGESGSLNNAADTSDRFLTVWERKAAPPGIFGRFFRATDLTSPAPVLNLVAIPGSQRIKLSWQNPLNADFTGAMIRYKSGGYPANEHDGLLLIDEPGIPGAADTYVHACLDPGADYYYAVFAHDAHPNYAEPRTTVGHTAVAGDFDVDGDVDQIDFGFLQACLSGDGIPFSASCQDADLDCEGDVDQADLALFLNCMRGSDTLPGC